jgi:hypothetical protein
MRPAATSSIAFDRKPIPIIRKGSLPASEASHALHQVYTNNCEHHYHKEVEDHQKPEPIG